MKGQVTRIWNVSVVTLGGVPIAALRFGIRRSIAPDARGIWAGRRWRAAPRSDGFGSDGSGSLRSSSSSVCSYSLGICDFCSALMLERAGKV